MKKGFRLVTSPGEITESMTAYHERGALRGRYLGFTKLDRRYSMAAPGVTDWTGFPQSGKTQICLELLHNCADFYGDKTFVYCPDIGTTQEVLGDLIHIHTGRTFDKRFKNKIDEATIAQAAPWISEHFIILEQEDPKAVLTPYEFWEMAVQLKTELGIRNALIDSWKDMSHTRRKEFGRDDMYLENVLSYRNMLAEQNELHFHTIIHPSKTDKGADGKRSIPGPYDLKGGSEWFNNGKVIISAHRPDNSSNIVELYFHKMKPRSIGSRGKAILHFDKRLLRYYEEDIDGEKLYAQKEKRKLKSEKVQDLVENQNGEQGELPYEDPEIPF